MSTEKDVHDFLKGFCSCIPKNFFSKMEETQRGMGFILIYLHDADKEVVAGDLARELNVSTPRIAALLKKMESNGLIVRHDSSRDGRKTVVEITAEGTEYLNRIKEDVLRKAELLFERIGSEDLEEFLRISYRIKEALEETEQG